MSTTVVVPVPDHGMPLFPSDCVSCGAPATAKSRLAVARLVASRGGGQQTRSVRWEVPHCESCAKATKAVFLAQLVPFAIGFLLAGSVAFVAAAWKSIEWGIDSMADLSPPRTPAALVLGAAAGLLVGLLGGLALEVLARVILLPVFGRALWRAPLLAPLLLTDGDYVAGLRGRCNADVSEMTLVFARGEAAASFTAANPAARAGA
jgi:hypothetical protein